MDEPVQFFLLILLVMLLLFSAFFSASESAFLSFSRIRLRHLVHKGDKRAKFLQDLLKRPDRLLGTILVGNNFVNVGAAAIATYLAGWWLKAEQGLILVTVVMTVLILIFGEITPKTFSVRHPERVSFFVLPAIRAFALLLSPAVKAVTFFSNLLLGISKVGKSEFFPSLSEEEIRSVIYTGLEEGALPKEKRRLLHNIFRMSETRVREVMIPRTMITALEVNASLAEVKEVIGRTGHSRLPVYEESLENIVGVVHTKDLIKSWEEGAAFSLKKIMRKPYFVPESARIETLLVNMQKDRVHLALAVDEYGGLEGIVTMEDLLEEIVGEIRDEYDQERDLILLLPDGSALVDGKISLYELNERLQLNLSGTPTHTLAGFILTHLGRIPEEKEEITLDDLRLRIEEISRRTIRKVLIKPTPSAL